VKSKGTQLLGLSQDSSFELFFFAEPHAGFNIVLDFYLERSGTAKFEKHLQSIGWLVTPIQCLPVFKSLNERQGRIASTKFVLLSGSARMLLDTSREQFRTSSQDIHVVVDS